MNASIARCPRVAALKPASRQVKAKAQEEVYIGKGKYVKDDPTKYPSRTELTGGWAGGEQGLKQFLGQLVRYSWLCPTSRARL